jgi:purine-binding chemotaxis protein CheW
MTSDISSGAGQYLTFFVHGDEFAVPVLRVREVMEALPVTHVPTAPTPIRGVVNVRGAVVPVVDLGLRFGSGEVETTRWTCMVIVDLTVGEDQRCMGLLVDRVNQVVDLDDAAIEEVPAFGVDVRLDFLTGMGGVGGKFILLLDVERVLSTSDLLAVTTEAAS